MSITRGFEVIKKKVDGTTSVIDYASWKDREFDTWVSDWMYLHIPIPKREHVESYGEYYSFILKKEDLLRMADDLMQRRFDVCPETSVHFWDEETEVYAEGMGKAFLALAQNLKDNEQIRYYDAGE